MPLLAQWTRQRPWLTAGMASAATGVVGLAGGFVAAAGAVGAMAFGGISTRATHHEHPLRRRILSTLDAHPGLCYRELQTIMNAANGTLRRRGVLRTATSVAVKTATVVGTVLSGDGMLQPYESLGHTTILEGSFLLRLSIAFFGWFGGELGDVVWP